jgi:hypothetical protein
MANISLTLYTNGFIGSVLMSPIQMGSLRVNNSVTNISRLGTFKYASIMLLLCPNVPKCENFLDRSFPQGPNFLAGGAGKSCQALATLAYSQWHAYGSKP